MTDLQPTRLELVDDSRVDLSTREVARRSIPSIVVLAIAIAVATGTQYDVLAVLLGALSGAIGVEYLVVLAERGIVWWDSLGFGDPEVDDEVEPDDAIEGGSGA
jgi:hypothetical protein